MWRKGIIGFIEENLANDYRDYRLRVKRIWARFAAGVKPAPVRLRGSSFHLKMHVLVCR